MMIRKFKHSLMFSVCCLAATCGMQTHADTPRPGSNGVAQPAAAAPVGDSKRADLAKVDEASGATSVRASQLLGMNVRNTDNRDIGEIQDVVLDARTGKARYVALSFGGFLGLGDKLFAIPWEKLQCQAGPGAGEYYLVLDLDQRALERAPGFDQDHWPDFSDAKYTEQVDQFYGTRIHAGNVEIDINRR